MQEHETDQFEANQRAAAQARRAVEESLEIGDLQNAYRMFEVARDCMRAIAHGDCRKDFESYGLIGWSLASALQNHPVPAYGGDGPSFSSGQAAINTWVAVEKAYRHLAGLYPDHESYRSWANVASDRRMQFDISPPAIER